MCADRIKAAMSQVLTAASIYYLALIPVLVGVWFGVSFIEPRDRHDFPGFAIQQPEPGGVLAAFGNGDGLWYADIARNGYSHTPHRGCNVVFFPLYPLVARGVASVSELNEATALLAVSHASLVLSILLLQRYVVARYPDSPPALADYAVLSLLLWPAGFFFRMAFSDSLFLLLVLLAMFGMLRNWPLLLIACTVGAATAARPVGVALVPVFLYHLWGRGGSAQTDFSRPLLAFASRSLWLGPLAVCGLLAFMAFLWCKFDDPLLFVTNQAQFNSRGDLLLPEKITNLAVLEPLWSPYVPGSQAYWRTSADVDNPVMSPSFMNPVYFVATVLLIAVGAWKRWLNGSELLLCVFLLGIPYLTKGHDNAMLGMARYATVAFPLYLVGGRLFERAPDVLRVLALACGAVLVAFYSALFAAWFNFV